MMSFPVRARAVCWLQGAGGWHRGVWNRTLRVVAGLAELVVQAGDEGVQAEAEGLVGAGAAGRGGGGCFG